MFDLDNLKPGDVVTSHHPANDKFILKRWFNQILAWRIRAKNKEVYAGSKDTIDTHVRIYVGKIFTIHVGFEFTFPFARFFRVNGIDKFTRVWRHKKFVFESSQQNKLYEECMNFNGSLYDAGELLADEFDNRRFDWGKKYKVCISGVAMFYELIFGQRMVARLDINGVVPASIANESEFELIYDGIQNENK